VKDRAIAVIQILPLLVVLAACEIPQNLPVIEDANVPQWSENTTQFTFTAPVTRGNGEPIPDTLTVKFDFSELHRRIRIHP
jgi:hypothetical protein